MSETMVMNQRVQWLEDFTAANRLADWGIAALRGTVEALREVGSDALADKLTIYADVITEATTAMDDAVSRSIREDFEESEKQIGLTFKALLETMNIGTEQQPPSSTRE